MTATRRAGVFGAGGFVGAAACDELTARNWKVVGLRAPRLRAEARDATEVAMVARRYTEATDQLAYQMQGLDAVVNAAGLALPCGGDLAALIGANALLPKVVADACEQAGVARLVHVSSAAVQGGHVPLDETARYWADSPYARSKALGEQAVLATLAGTKGCRAVVLRPTSVHGSGRALTRLLIRIARSPLASVMATGEAPTPQVLVGNVGAAAAHLCGAVMTPPAIVLQPWEGWSATSFIQLLSGRSPHQIPSALGLSALWLARLLCPKGSLVAYRRRLELLWLGQAQVLGWLINDGFTPTYGRGDWERMVGDVIRTGAA